MRISHDDFGGEERFYCSELFYENTPAFSQYCQGHFDRQTCLQCIYPRMFLKDAPNWKGVKHPAFSPIFLPNGVFIILKDEHGLCKTRG